MVTRYLAPLAVIGLGLSLVCADQTKPAPAKADSAAVAKLVAQLGSDRFEDREAACEALDALGPIALKALHSALANGDLETRRRAKPPEPGCRICLARSSPRARLARTER